MDPNNIIAYQLITEWSQLDEDRVETFVRLVPNHQGQGRLLDHSYPYCAVFLVVPLVGAEPVVFYLDPRDMETLWWFVDDEEPQPYVFERSGEEELVHSGEEETIAVLWYRLDPDLG